MNRRSALVIFLPESSRLPPATTLPTALSFLKENLIFSLPGIVQVIGVGVRR
jgi:hypothetical protein